jgi:hypothetical protein
MPVPATPTTGVPSTGTSPSATAPTSLEGLSPEAVLARVKTALAEVKTVRYRSRGPLGDRTNARETDSGDVWLVNRKGSTGTRVMFGEPMRVLTFGSDRYLAGDLTVIGVPGTGNKWVKLPRSGGTVTDLTVIVDKFEFLTMDTTKLSLGTPRIIEGRSTVAVVVTADQEPRSATMYVAAEGPALPLLIETRFKDRTDTEAFSEYDRPVVLRPPAASQVLAGAFEEAMGRAGLGG